MKNNVVATVADEIGGMERQISNMSIVDVQRRSTDPTPGHTNTTTILPLRHHVFHVVLQAMGMG
jgi:hypothetical protein